MTLEKRQIKLLQDYRDKTYVFSILCNENADYFSLIRTCMKIPLILCSSVMTVLNSFNRINNDDLQICNITLNASTALILSMMGTLNINDKISNFKMIGIKMNKLCSNIEDELTNNLNDITHEDIRKIINEYNNLVEGVDFAFASHIKKRVKDRFINKKILPNELNCVISFIKEDEKKEENMIV